MGFGIDKSSDWISVLLSAAELQFLLGKIYRNSPINSKEQLVVRTRIDWTGEVLQQQDIKQISSLTDTCCSSIAFGSAPLSPWKDFCRRVDPVTLFKFMIIITPADENVPRKYWTDKLKDLEKLIISIEEVRKAAIYPVSNRLGKHVVLKTKSKLFGYEKLYNIILHYAFNGSSNIAGPNPSLHPRLNQYIGPVRSIFRSLTNACTDLLKQAQTLKLQYDKFPQSYKTGKRSNIRKKQYLDSKVAKFHVTFLDENRVTKVEYDDLQQYVTEIGKEVELFQEFHNLVS